MALKEFLKSKVFFKHLLLIAASFLVLMFIVSWILKIYTRHGQEYEVPNITGLNIKDIESSEELKHFEIMILDSVFKEGVLSGTVLTQDPSEGSLVKSGRKIYITIASYSGEMIRMPLCKDKGIKSAVQTLVDAGLRVGTIMYRTGEIDNIVAEQRYKGKPINVGSDIITGEAVDLVVEVRSTTEEVTMPDILSKTEAEAEVLLWKAGLNIGRKVYQGANEPKHTRVISYSPTSRKIMIGSAVNLTFMNDSERAYKRQIEDFQQERLIEQQIEDSDTAAVQTDVESE
ncbi:MAG: PASTA domain-containing protein [Bacteroidales bacterium]|nr:PASTA domain-containing protein [Bacteroidales bacterium]